MAEHVYAIPVKILVMLLDFDRVLTNLSLYLKLLV